MYSESLMQALGLLNLQHKSQVHNEPTQQVVSTSIKAADSTSSDAIPKLDKNEFRLLVKMLQAIGHKCQFEDILYDGQYVQYKHPKTILYFKDISLPDSDSVINLSSLSDLLSNDSLKRPVWEKLKSLKT